VVLRRRPDPRCSHCRARKRTAPCRATVRGPRSGSRCSNAGSRKARRSRESRVIGSLASASVITSPRARRVHSNARAPQFVAHDYPGCSGDKGPAPGEAGTVELGHGCLLIMASSRRWSGLCDLHRH
jgi:hypothetical protein